MPEPLDAALAAVRADLLDTAGLVRAVGSGRRRGDRPRWRRVELRYVDLRAGRRLQVTRYDDTQAHTGNHPLGAPAEEAVDALLAEPFGNWRTETADRVRQLRVTKKGEAVTHTAAGDGPAAADRGHDRGKARLLPEDDPVLEALGLARDGRVKPSRQAKYRQVEEFLRTLDGALTEALDKGHLRTPTPDDPLRVVDLGCGNAYLTFAAQRYLGHVRGLPVRLVGADVKEQSREHNEEVARRLGEPAEFVVGSISDVRIDPAPEVVLALHACDTATDDALARAVQWRAPLVLAAPCCHHDVAAQLRRSGPPAPYSLLTRHGILRERFADTLTDGVRAALLRMHGYRVDVVEFVGSEHTPRNTLLRAVRTGVPGSRAEVEAEYRDLVGTWGLRPRLEELLDEQAGRPAGEHGT